jgi:lipoprotein-anchoring transpeptidase ErfK/SrfK
MRVEANLLKLVALRRRGARVDLLGRMLVAGALALLAAACTSSIASAPSVETPPPVMYGALEDGGFTIKAVSPGRVDPKYLRQVVTTPRYIPAEPGTLVVDPTNRFLYLVQANGTSMRYGIGVGREGFAWTGEAVIKDKQHWPKWFPPKEMMERDPEAAKYPDGMDGGPGNPLGARALYLWQGGKDTLYRLHGTNDPSSIGKAVSSGCVRLLNQDIIDLYERVPLGTKVVVLGAEEPLAPLVDLFSRPLFPPRG